MEKTAAEFGNKENRMEKLLEIAAGDAVYRTWSGILREEELAFENFADQQPQEVRDLLWGYVGIHRILADRMLELACEYMAFSPKEEPGKIRLYFLPDMV